MLVRIDTKLELLMKMFDSLKLDVQKDFDEVWSAIDNARKDIHELQTFSAEAKGASHSINWLVHIIISLPAWAVAGIAGFFASR